MNTIQEERILLLLQQPTTLEKGFRLLMDSYQEPLYWHIRRMVLDHDDANDVIQNTFIKAFRGIGAFEGKSKLYTWLYRIATNEAITFLNKKKQLSISSIDEGEHSIASQLAADSYFDGDEAQQKLKEAIAQLPDKQRAVFNMRYYDEMPYEQMSEVMETSVGALKASFHHAVKKIENFFNKL